MYSTTNQLKGNGMNKLRYIYRLTLSTIPGFHYVAVEAVSCEEANKLIQENIVNQTYKAQFLYAVKHKSNVKLIGDKLKDIESGGMVSFCPDI